MPRTFLQICRQTEEINFVSDIVRGGDILQNRGGFPPTEPLIAVTIIDICASLFYQKTVSTG